MRAVRDDLLRCTTWLRAAALGAAVVVAGCGSSAGGASADGGSQGDAGADAGCGLDGGCSPELNPQCPLAALPTPESTGWQHTGVVLQAPSAPVQVTASSYVVPGGSTVDGVDFAGKNVSITGGGPVVITRSRVTSGDLAAVSIESGAGPVTLRDVEITSIDKDTAEADRILVVAKGNTQPVTLERVYGHDCMRGIDITGENNITIRDSYLAFNYNPGTGERAHSSAIRAAGGVHDVAVINTVLGVGANSYASGLAAFYPENGANYDVVFDCGLWIIQPDNDGAYGVAVGYTPGAGESQNYNFTVKNVWISTQYYADGCPSGCGQNWDQAPGSPIGPLGGTKVWQNNLKYDPGQPDHGEPIGP